MVDSEVFINARFRFRPRINAYCCVTFTGDFIRAWETGLAAARDRDPYGWGMRLGVAARDLSSDESDHLEAMATSSVVRLLA